MYEFIDSLIVLRSIRFHATATQQLNGRVTSRAGLTGVGFNVTEMR